MGDDIEVGRLNAGSHWDWAIRMEGLLLYKDLGDCFYRDASGLAAGDPEKLRDRKALVLIQIHMSSTLLPMVVIHQTAKAAWDEFKAVRL
jgi:hypothetical protein